MRLKVEIYLAVNDNNFKYYCKITNRNRDSDAMALVWKVALYTVKSSKFFPFPPARKQHEQKRGKHHARLCLEGVLAYKRHKHYAQI